MATYNFTDGSIAGAMKPADHTPEEDSLFILRNIIDCALQNLDAGDGDIAEVLNIPAGVTVLDVWIRVITAETANGTCDLGVTTTNPDQWGDALALDTTAGGILQILTDKAPLYFAAADTIDVLATTDTADVDIDGAKFEVCALCLKSLDSY